MSRGRSVIRPAALGARVSAASRRRLCASLSRANASEVTSRKGCRLIAQTRASDTTVLPPVSSTTGPAAASASGCTGRLRPCRPAALSLAPGRRAAPNAAGARTSGRPGAGEGRRRIGRTPAQPWRDLGGKGVGRGGRLAGRIGSAAGGRGSSAGHARCHVGAGGAAGGSTSAAAHSADFGAAARGAWRRSNYADAAERCGEVDGRGVGHAPRRRFASTGRPLDPARARQLPAPTGAVDTRVIRSALASSRVARPSVMASWPAHCNAPWRPVRQISKAISRPASSGTLRVT